jgi:sterol desaturase/sphingolipid hydroxylase (fatty acid hydroxylase superfamily)
VSTEQQHADARRNKRARLLSPRFSLLRHLTAFATLATAGIATGVWLVRRVQLPDLWIVPAYLLVSNVVEYLMHRLLMHRPLWPRTLYRGHTLGHHRAFHHQSMEIGGWRELELVMMPWFSIGLFFVALAPIVVLCAWALDRGAAGLLVLTAVVSFVLYEGIHALYHFPLPVLERLGLLGNPVFAVLYRHHRHHHRLARMRWVNFNISLPFSDALFGTLETEAAWRMERDRRAGAGADDGEDIARNAKSQAP